MRTPAMKNAAPAFALLATLALGAAPPALQQVVDLDLQAMANPTGIQAAGAFSLRKALSGSDAQAPDTYVQGGASASLCPAYTVTGLFAEWQPFPFFQLHVQGDAFKYFGTYGALLSFKGPRDPFGAGDLDRRKGEEEAGSAQRLQALPVLQAKAGPVIFRHQATLGWYRFHGQGPWYFEYENDLLMKAHDRVQDHQTQVLVETLPAWGKVVLGGSWQTTRGRESGLYRRRAGLMAAWEGTGAPGRLGRPRAYVQAGPVLEDRNRKGQFYLLMGVGTTWLR